MEGNRDSLLIRCEKKQRISIARKTDDRQPACDSEIRYLVAANGADYDEMSALLADGQSLMDGVAGEQTSEEPRSWFSGAFRVHSDPVLVVGDHEMIAHANPVPYDELRIHKIEEHELFCSTGSYVDNLREVKALPPVFAGQPRL